MANKKSTLKRIKKKNAEPKKEDGYVRINIMDLLQQGDDS